MSLEEEREGVKREVENQAQQQLEKAKVLAGEGTPASVSAKQMLGEDLFAHETASLGPQQL